MVTTRSLSLPPQSEPNPEIPQNGLLSRPLENFKAAVIRFAAEKLQRPLTEAEVGRIENDIAEKKHILSRTPDHPPYAAMIRTALLELNEEGGSSEMSISNFIKKENPSLPFAHSEYLKHYLDKLCNSNHIAVNSANHYVLIDHNASSPVSLERDSPKEELRERRGRPRKKEEELGERRGRPRKKEEELGERRGRPRKREEELRERRGRPRKEGQTRKGKKGKGKEKLITNGLESVMPGEQNETTEEHNQQIEDWSDTIQEEKSGAVVNGPHEHKQTRMKFLVSKTEPTVETVVPAVPLAVVDQKDVEKLQQRKLKPERKQKLEAASTTSLILDLAHSNSKPLEQVRPKKLGRPCKIESSGEERNLQEQQLPKGRGRPRKTDKQQATRGRGRPPRKVDM